MWSLDSLMKNDVNIPQLKGYLQCAGNILENLPDPVIMRNNINQMNQTIENTLKPTLDQLAAQLNTLQTSTLPATTTALSSIAGATNMLNDIRSGLQSYNTALQGIAAWTTATSQATLDAFSNSQTTLTRNLATWITQVDTLNSSLTYLEDLKQNNQFSRVNNNIATLSQTANQLQSTDIPNIKTMLQRLDQLYNTTPNTADVVGCFGGLIRRCEQINNTVVQLDQSGQQAYENLTTMYNSLNALYKSSGNPKTFISQLDSVSNSLTMPSDLPQMQQALTDATNNLNSIPPQSNTRTYLKDLRSGLASMQTPVGLVRTDFDKFQTSRQQNDLNALKLTAAAAKVVTDAAISKLPPMTPIPAEMNNAITTAGQMQAQVNQLGNSLPGMVSTVNSGRNAIKNLPNTQDLTKPLDTITSSWNTLPKPKPSKLLDPTVKFLDDLLAAGVSTPRGVWGDINNTIDQFAGQTSKIQEVVDKINDIKKDQQKNSDNLFQIAVQALWGLYALLAAFCIITVIFALFNYTWGVRLWPALVLILAVLLLLLAVIWALVMVVFNDVCFNMEDLVLEQDFVDPRINTLMSFYMRPKTGNTTASQVLKYAGIIDIDQVLGDVSSASRNLTQKLANSFNLRPKALDIVASASKLTDDVTANVTHALRLADHGPLHNLYLNVKHWICCQLTDFGRNQWIGLTLSSLFAWFMVLLVFSLVSALDRTSQTFFGCECLPSKRITDQQQDHLPIDTNKKKKQEMRMAELEMQPPGSPRIGAGVSATDRGTSSSMAPALSPSTLNPSTNTAGGEDLDKCNHTATPSASYMTMPPFKLEPIKF